MKTKLGFLAICTLFLSQLCLAQKASPADIKKTVTYLKKSTKKVLKLGKQLSEDQLNFQPDESTWSIGGNIEHLIKTDGLYEIIINKALSNEAEQGIVSNISDENVIAFVANRSTTSTRVKTAPSLVPARMYTNFRDAKAALIQSRKKIIKYLKTTEDELRGHFAKHPSLGNADLFQWYILAAAHTERHYLQMLEVSQNSNFPIK